MAEQIISPGVFTRENDLSFLPQGVGAIGAAIIGPTVKGPAFVPTVIRSFSEYERMFGTLSSETFVPQTVREYLKNAGSVTVVRVLAGGGYTFSNGSIEPVAVIAGSGDEVVAAVATGSLTTENGTLGLNASDEIQITVGGNEFRFIATDPGDATGGGLPADNSPVFYFATGSSAALVATQAVTKINAASIGVLAKSGSDGVDGIEFTASAAGTAAITIETGSGGTISTDVLTLGGGVDSSVAGGLLLGVIYPSRNTSTSPSLGSSVTAPASGLTMTDNFGITLAGTSVTSTSFSASVNPINDNYLFKFLGDDPNNSKSGVVSYAGTAGYTYLNFKNLQSSVLATNSLSGYGAGIGSGSVVLLANMSAVDADFNGITTTTEKYSYASTPFIQSQINLGRKQLFRFHTISHGTELNTQYKISISNLREPADIDGEEQYSTFTVTLRPYHDNDKNPLPLETYENLNLNPDSPNYIARKIGDRFPQYNDILGKVELLGNYPNISNVIRVEVSDTVDAKATSPKLSPKGFGAVQNPFNTASLSVNSTFPSASYETVQQVGTAGTYDARGFLGWKSNEKEKDNYNFLKPLPDAIESNTAGAFNVENHTAHASSGLWTGSLSATIDTTGTTGPTAGQLKFTVPFQGGTDGIAPWTVKFTGAESSVHANYSDGSNLYGFNLSTIAQAGFLGYKKALDIITNQDEYDINMLAVPGVIHSIHPLVTSKGIDVCEGRGDTFFVMDLSPKDASVNTAVSNASGLDTNYAAVYYPWVKVLDTAANKPVFVPPSVIVPGAIAASDAIGAEWFAPAGLNRGILGNVIEAKLRLNQAERDVLYNAKINPIATFPATGVCIWGQKTLQERPTALDRINVRRLLITLKKFIASSSKYLVFEQNTQATRNRFLNIVNPYLESVQQRQGLFAFRVQMDEANNTPDVIDRNQLVGAIYLQPTKTAEFIILDFNVLPTGATFDA
tara:strand:+ start:924 stop:3812 length:2889 start_codon:yes stop_codon:yes gene_type:complete